MLKPLVAISLVIAGSAWLFAAPFVQIASAQQPSEIFVQVANARLRQQPKHWAPGTGDLGFGSKLTVLSSSSGWLKVRSPSGQEGFIHDSAVTSRKVILTSTLGNSGAVNVRADDSDVVLAGKGFSREMESGLAATRTDLNFSAVDSLLEKKVSDAQLAQFIKSGKLKDS